MSRKNNRPEWHGPVNSDPINNEQTEVVVVEVFDPIEDTIEVGEVILADGPLDSVSLGVGAYGTERYDEPRPSAAPMYGLGAAEAVTDTAKDKAQDVAQGVAQTAQDAGRKAQDVVQDVTQRTQETAQDLAGKAQDAAQSVAGKAQDVAQSIAGKAQNVAQDVAGKAQDVAQGMAGKAQDVTQKVAETASGAKAAASGALDSAKSAVPIAKSVIGNAVGKIGTVSVSGAQTAGSALWNLFQRNPLQAIFVIASLVWLFRNNKAAASQPAISLSDAAGDAAEKVGSVAGHVQVAATNLGSQVSEQASRGAGWFSRTLQESPLAIGAMAIVFGVGLGFIVPETSYEDKLLGATRDKLAGKAQEAAQDLTQKVTEVAQTATQEAIKSVKSEAKNQGLTSE